MLIFDGFFTVMVKGRTAMLKEDIRTSPLKEQTLNQEHKILLVDDDEDTLKIVGYYLQHHGYKVVVARNGSEALDLAQKDTPMLAIIDRMMPGIDGLQLARRLRQFRPDIYLIMLTAMDDDESRISGLQAGVDDYITKPFNLKELMLRVEAKFRRYLTQAPAQNTSNVDSSSGKNLQGINKQAQIKNYLEVAKQLVHNGDKEQAQEFFSRILQLDPYNKSALFWLAKHSSDPEQTVQHLERLIQTNPGNPQLEHLLEVSQQRWQELNQLINTSDFFNYWQNAEQLQNDRLKKGVDHREVPITTIGKLLQEKGYITSNQLSTAISLQEMLRRLGEQLKLGEILIEYGYLTAEQLDKALAEQRDEYNSQFY
jgi:DNA-binding response OmpR family regulator